MPKRTETCKQLFPLVRAIEHCKGLLSTEWSSPLLHSWKREAKLSSKHMFLNSAPLDEYLITHLWHHHILLKTCKGCKNVHSEHINQKKARKNPLCTAWTNAAHALPRSVPTLPVESILITTCHNNNQKKNSTENLMQRNLLCTWPKAFMYLKNESYFSFRMLPRTFSNSWITQQLNLYSLPKSHINNDTPIT